ncbi:hypothetical protein ACE3MQ_16760 [Paenibacillus lentus]|uniref:hypothetical protein n=1 Tax=Paenibacillus lentus TaxID=1338368 RepID=UPI003662F3E3
MPSRQILVCSSIFLFMVCGAAFLERRLPSIMPPEQFIIYSQPQSRIDNHAAFQPREYIRIVQFPGRK